MLVDVFDQVHQSALNGVLFVNQKILLSTFEVHNQCGSFDHLYHDQMT